MTVAQYERQAQRMRERHEDIEDLLSLGATVAEIIERSDYKNWRGLHTSLKVAGREDLLGRLKAMLAVADLPAQWPVSVPAPTCRGSLCANKPLYGGLCLFHEGAQYRWCNEPGCPKPTKHLNKCGAHYESKLLKRR